MVFSLFIFHFHIKFVLLHRIWFSPTSEIGWCGDGAKMGMG
jgi:hypothetical protein